MKMRQISPNTPFPALAPCSSAQLEPAVSEGQQPSVSLCTASRPCDGERAAGSERRAAVSRSACPDSQAPHKPHRATPSFSNLTLGTWLNSLSPYYWEMCFPSNTIQMFLKKKNKKRCFLKIYLFIFRERGKEGERERNINVWVPLPRPLLGTWPATQACTPTGNQTSDLSVRQLVLNPLSHTSQGCFVFYEGSSTCSLQKTWVIQKTHKRKFKSLLARHPEKTRTYILVNNNNS